MSQDRFDEKAKDFCDDDLLHARSRSGACQKCLSIARALREAYADGAREEKGRMDDQVNFLKKRAEDIAEFRKIVAAYSRMTRPQQEDK